jgi:beta-glucosidase-like glycosyl hydrolase
MTEIAQLLLPAIRWDAERGYEPARAMIDLALERGVGGFILFGGKADAVRELTADLRARSRLPLLIGADLERGAGQQFAGAIGLPPLAAIASLGDEDALRGAASLTAREARTLGINWIYQPVCDLDIEPEMPIRRRLPLLPHDGLTPASRSGSSRVRNIFPDTVAQPPIRTPSFRW